MQYNINRGLEGLEDATNRASKGFNPSVVGPVGSWYSRRVRKAIFPSIFDFIIPFTSSIFDSNPEKRI